MTLSKGDRVRVVKGRVSFDPIIGKTGTVIDRTWTAKPLWIVCLDDEVYTSDDTGTLLNPSDIELIREKA